MIVGLGDTSQASLLDEWQCQNAWDVVSSGDSGLVVVAAAASKFAEEPLSSLANSNCCVGRCVAEVMKEG